MINSIEEFKKEHPRAVIVNYDIAEQFDCGMTYRTKTGKVELFAKDRGKYIKYPFIQPYLTLNNESGYELFIIHNAKMYELELGSSEHTYKIKKEIDNISPLINKDDVFYNVKIRKNPVVINEPIYTIEE